MKYILFLLCLLPLFVDGQIITTFAGGGLSGVNNGDGGPATAATINYICGGAFDRHGNFYIATGTAGNTIRKVNTFGIVTTIAGTGIAGYSGDGGPALAAKLKNPQGISIDSSDNLFFSDCFNYVIRKINLSSGIISTYAGTGISGYGGDGGPATSALFSNPNGISCDKLGNLFVADYNNHRVRKINSGGIITTSVGTGVAGFNGDGGLADTSQITGAFDVCNDNLNNLYVADESGGRIRKISTAGIITTVAGTGITGFSGDGGNATTAQVRMHGITVDKNSNIFFTDIYVNRVRKIDASGIISTVVGTGVAGYNGDNIIADTATLKSPAYLSVDTCGNLYIGDGGNYRVRKVTFDTSCGKPATNNHTGIASSPLTHSMIYPNPALNEIHIDGITIAASYTLTDMVGVSVQHGALRVGDNTIDISGVSKGVYLVTVINEDGLRTVYKLLKQ